MYGVSPSIFVNLGLALIHLANLMWLWDLVRITLYYFGKITKDIEIEIDDHTTLEIHEDGVAIIQAL
jgi:hypothetical protein